MLEVLTLKGAFDVLTGFVASEATQAAKKELFSFLRDVRTVGQAADTVDKRFPSLNAGLALKAWAKSAHYRLALYELQDGELPSPDGSLLDSFLDEFGSGVGDERRGRARQVLGAFFQELLDRFFNRQDGRALAVRYLRGEIVSGNEALRTYLKARFDALDHTVSGNQALDEWLKTYLGALIRESQHLALGGIDPEASDMGRGAAGKPPMRLDRVYVELRVQIAPSQGVASKTGLRDTRALLDARRGSADAREDITARGAVATSTRLVLLGDPGSGKSTVLRHIALELARYHVGPQREAETIPEAWQEWGAPIPLYIVLRDLDLPAEPSRAEAGDLWNCLEAILKRKVPGCAESALLQRVKQGEVVLLLDGLDEVSTVEGRRFLRDAVQEFLDLYEQARIVLTCRVLAYGVDELHLRGVPEARLEPLSDGQIDAFIEAWHDELEAMGRKTSEEAASLRGDLQRAVKRSDVGRLAPSPLLLTVMAFVHTHTGRLPEARAKLYEEAINLMLRQWESQKATTNNRPPLNSLLLEAEASEKDLYRVLSELAFNVHQDSDPGQEEGAADIPYRALCEALKQLHPQQEERWARDCIRAVQDRAGLLVERRPEGAEEEAVFSFPHRTFQEYLAGVYLAADPLHFSKRCLELADADFSLWKVVLVLATGKLMHVDGGLPLPLDFAQRLCPSDISPESEEVWRRVWLAGEVLLELGRPRVERDAIGKEVVPRVQQMLLRLVRENGLPAQERVQAADVLGRLGDPRKEVTDATATAWRPVPAGPFTMGDHDETHEADVPEAFWISTYPITVAQYAQFVEDRGYADPRWWPVAERHGQWNQGEIQALGESASRFPWRWSRQLDAKTRPVSGITWYEALAFCAWLTEKLRSEAETRLHMTETPGERSMWTRVRAGALVVMLPSEAEWEKAARGTDGRAYPWGTQEPAPERANYGGHVGSTSAVGCYLDGCSPYQVEDMAGNVWEWTRSCYQNYPYDADDGRERLMEHRHDVARVLRGGSFYGDDGSVRCAARYHGSPNFRLSYLGFRIVLRPSLDSEASDR
ncbi:MAG: SUMF1/EgtB/PvdO family nonheme iron enzyme [Bacteroidota bacterium]